MSQYNKISKVIDILERTDLESPQGIQLSTWCSDQITWAYKWRKINKPQMEELCDRMVKIFEGDIK